MAEQQLTSEAELIALLAPLTAGAPGAFGLRDDCAQLSPRPGYDLVLKTDPVRAGVHFFADDAPEDIAWKALAVNVSDLAAKGAEPVAYLMALSFPEVPERAWMTRFAEGLRQAQTAFGCHLIGGDTDRAPGPLSIAITVIGEVPTGQMVQRGTARTGDAIYVSGTLGDAGLGLIVRRDVPNWRDEVCGPFQLPARHITPVVQRYLRPQPRIELAGTLRQHASAAMDLSDGLVKDLERMCKASGVGAEIDCGVMIFSDAVQWVLNRQPELLSTILSAGEDYEILAAVPPQAISAFEAKIKRTSVQMQRIGTFVEGSGVVVKRMDGSEIKFDRKGWEHF